MAYLVGVLAAIVAIESWLLWRVPRSLRAVEQFTDRVAHLTGALHLLTETAESGFAAMASVLNDTRQPPARRRGPRRPGVPASRVSGAAAPLRPASGDGAPRLDAPPAKSLNLHWAEDA